METLKNKMIEVLSGNTDNAIRFSGNLDYGVEEFIGAYVDGDDIYLVTKEDVDIPVYYVEEEIDEEIVSDLLEEITNGDFEVVDIDEL